jgi:hypothetical protein
LSYEIFYKDTLRTAFYDAFSYDKNGRGIAISDPTNKKKATLEFTKKNYNQDDGIIPLYNDEAKLILQPNTNIATVGNTVWMQQVAKLLGFLNSPGTSLFIGMFSVHHL